MITSVWVAFVFFAIVALLPMLGKIWEIRQDLRPDYIRAVIVDAAKRARTYFRKIQIDDDLGEYIQVKKGEGKYIIDQTCIVRRGMLRVPYLYYVQGKYRPINLYGGKNDGNAIEVDAVGEHHLMRDLLGAFNPEKITLTVVLVVMVLGFLLVGFGVYKGVDTDVQKVITNQIREDPALAYTPTPIAKMK